MNSVNSGHLEDICDCVVMLTWSNWKTEPRSNRYHYASRFARHLPVIFVQPDLAKPEVRFEETEVTNVVILHIYRRFGRKQSLLLNEALLSRKFHRPLLWVYNVYFKDFIAQRYAPLLVYHATEDYFSPDVTNSSEMRQALRRILSQTDLLVAVSPNVLDSYVKQGRFNGNSLLLENGCDFPFWAPAQSELERLTSTKFSRKVAFYQGGINKRLNINMLTEICRALPDWEFWICGAVDSSFDHQKINPRRLPNLRNFGFLGVEKVRELAYQATVGIIPFIQNDMTRVSLPLKAFEYVACGLPVVTVPIPALEKYPDCFTFADNPEGFSHAMRGVAETRHDPQWIERRLDAAREQDYDARFSTLLQKLEFLLNSKTQVAGQLNILVLYDANSMHVNTIREHLTSFSRYSTARVLYASCTDRATSAGDLSVFDAIIIHYCVRVSVEDHLSPSFARALREFGGYKILFIQDEYDTTETARRWIERLGIHAIFTCIPKEYVDQIYPSTRFPGLERIQTLTGFVPMEIEKYKTKPISKREIIVGYRGRQLPFYYGDLGREKMEIAQRMKQICRDRGITEDIEWSEEKRIYGDEWYSFVANSKVTLGTESGSNVFDEYGEIKRNVDRALAQDPSLSYEEIHTRYIGEREGKIKMNQISPRIFEAIALRTALILYEGRYSGIIQPDIHYIPLKKDLSNLEDVLSKITNDEYLMELTERAYRDIILSNKHTYEQFIREFDEFLSKRVRRRSYSKPLVGLVGVREPQNGMVSEAVYTEILVNNFLTPLTAIEIQSTVFIVSQNDIIVVPRLISSWIISILEKYLILYGLVGGVWFRVKRIFRISLRGRNG